MNYCHKIVIRLLIIWTINEFKVMAAQNDTSNATITAVRNIIYNLEVPEQELLLLHPAKMKQWAKKYGREDVLSKPKDKLCFCDAGICTCCTGFLLGLIGQKACVQVRYTPVEFAFDVAMVVNEKVMYETRVSGKDPKPVCFSPPRLDSLKMCAKFSNIFFPGRNLHFCANMFGQWGNVPLFDISFDCLRMGAQGIAMVKPEDNGGIEVANPGGGVDAIVDTGVDDIEDYDENLVRSLFDIFER